MTEKKNVTFDDIAKYTNFSKTTISRYFNNPESITLKNQEIICDALKALNYQENKVARILANGKTEFIGIILPNLHLPYYCEILHHTLSTYETFGYKFLVFVSDGNTENERSYIHELLAYKVEGLLILSDAISSEELAALPVPVVTIDREDRSICSVNTDNYLGGVEAASLLVRQGCDMLIHLHPDIVQEKPVYRYIKGFQDFCANKGVDHQLIPEKFTGVIKTDQKILKSILNNFDSAYSQRKKGIVASDDSIANIVLNLLIRKHKVLPDDYLIIGFGDAPVSRQSIMTISTVRQKTKELAFEAVNMLVEQMDERKKRRPVPLTEPIHKIISPLLIRRETTEK